MVIGSGPIVIGQAAEFDYSGTQACRSLREEGVRVVLVNSNPATIQTDPDTADAVYVEPLTVEFLEKVIAKEKPQGILSGMGGQTALNLCSELADAGILQRHGVELLGTKLEAIAAGENRERFASLMRSIGEPIPRSRAVSDSEAARAFVEEMGYPVIVRAAYTLGGSGSGVAHSPDELDRIVALGLAYSRIKQVLVEESVLGWKEFEYEVMRDAADNCITICSMENLDPMGVHTGESIVVAPAQTLSDSDHQTLRSAALRIIRALGVEGGCNIQFAVHPKTGEYRVIEVNPRVSRSSALASKATGYPIARIAAKIAIGLRLDEIPNPVTGKTLASFEPTLDYVVTKIPRWPFDKFPTVDRRIGTSMKSTGEVMAIGRTFEESLLKAVRSLEIDRIGLESNSWSEEELVRELREPTDERLFAIAEAVRRRLPTEKIASLTGWDPFFIEKIRHLVRIESVLRGSRVSKAVLAEAKRFGFADESLSALTGGTEESVRRSDLDQSRGPARPRVGPPSFADSDPRHATGRDRPRRGPSKVRGAHAAPSNPATGRGLRVQLRRGPRGGLPDRLPRSRPAVVRPRWPRDGDRPRRRGPRPVHGKGGPCLEGAPGPRGPVSVPRDRDRRGRRRGWQGHLHRRDPGAHRGSGHSLRRRRLCIAGPDPLRSRPRGDPPNHAEDLRRPGDRRPDEPPARGEGRCGVRPRGESARESNDSLRLEGHRRVPREGRDEGDARSIPAQHGPRGRGEHRPRRREGPRVPVPEAPGRRHDPRPRDEEYGRGDGDRSVPRPRVLQGDGCGRERPADGGGGLHDRAG